MSRDVVSHPPIAHPYGPAVPYASGYIEVDAGHQIYWEACGNPQGRPALFLHGGPGGGCNSNHRRRFDPQRYRVVLFDQRGCGRSKPHAAINPHLALRANTTSNLVSDMEMLRRTLSIDRWLLMGGSWGATLALAYAQSYPERVSAMILRGVFTARLAELRWLYQGGAACLYPEAWERFNAPIPESERGNLVAAYHALLIRGGRGAAEDGEVVLRTARAWCAWEDALMTLRPEGNTLIAGNVDDAAVLALARIEAHYMANNCFLEEGQLISNAHRMSSIPGVIIQGRHDAITPAATAFELHRAWPTAALQMVEDAGHASSESGIAQRLIAATDRFASG